MIDQNLSVGSGGILFGEIAAALQTGGDATAPLLASFIGGLGGRDIGANEFAGDRGRNLRDAARERHGATAAPALYRR